MSKKILLDMDGLLTNWMEGVCRVHNRPDPFLDPANNGKFDVDKIWGMTPTEFWRPMDREWWESLQPTEEAELIVAWASIAVGGANVAICTSPSRNEGCYDGKVTWVAKYFPQFLVGKRRVFAMPAKEFCASPDRLLIDDYDKNIESFVEEGGQGYLFPRPWNSRHYEQDIAMHHLKSVIDVFGESK